MIWIDVLLPYASVNCQVPRVRFYLLNSEESPRIACIYKKISPWGDDYPKWIYQLPYASVNCQVPRVRFYLLNSEESPRFRTVLANIGKIVDYVNRINTHKVFRFLPN